MGVCEGREVVGCRGSEDMGVGVGVGVGVDVGVDVGMDVGVGVGNDASTAGSAETAGVDS